MKNKYVTNLRTRCGIIGMAMLFFSIQVQAQVGDISFDEASSNTTGTDFMNGLSMIANVVLAICAVIGVCLTTFALLGAASDGRWDEAKSKIGAGFALIAVPAALKAIWVLLEAQGTLS